MCSEDDGPDLEDDSAPRMETFVSFSCACVETHDNIGVTEKTAEGVIGQEATDNS